MAKPAISERMQQLANTLRQLDSQLDALSEDGFTIIVEGTGGKARPGTRSPWLDITVHRTVVERFTVDSHEIIDDTNTSYTAKPGTPPVWTDLTNDEEDD